MATSSELQAATAHIEPDTKTKLKWYDLARRLAFVNGESIAGLLMRLLGDELEAIEIDPPSTDRLVRRLTRPAPEIEGSEELDELADTWVRRNIERAAGPGGWYDGGRDEAGTHDV